MNNITHKELLDEIEINEKLLELMIDAKDDASFKEDYHNNSLSVRELKHYIAELKKDLKNGNYK